MRIVTPDWLRDAVFYQVFPDRFARSGRVPAPGPFEDWEAPPTGHGFKGGDLYGIAARLDDLRGLGVNAIYLNPIFASAANHRYHTYDYFTVDPLLGGNGALRELLDAAHARGIRVVLDGVFNHASRGFWPFHHVLECGIGSPYLDWFHVDREALAAGGTLRAYPDVLALGPGDLTAWADEHRLSADSLARLGYRAWWDLPALPKLNTDNPHVREYIFDVAEHWIRFGIDGWRLDVADEIDDDEFWREFRRRVKALDPEAYIVAEIWSEDRRWLQGDQFDAYMNYPLASAILSFCGGTRLDMRVVGQSELRSAVRPEDGPTFAARLARAMTLHDPAIAFAQLNVLASHDTPRIRSMCGGDLDAVRLATLVQMTVIGAPCIYYGDEIGLEGEQDPACRGAYPTDPARRDTLLQAFFAGATALRHAHRALRRGDFAIVGADGPTCAYRRSDGDETLVVCLNAGDEPARLSLVVPEIDGRTLVQETWPGWTWAEAGPLTVRSGRLTIELPARQGRVLRTT